MSVTPERKLAAIMLADIASFSSMMERDESGTFERVRALREKMVTPLVAMHRGRVIKTTGDGFLAEFPSATSALECGIALQRSNHAQQREFALGERIRIRIGINVGDIIIDGQDVAGDGVVVAARLEPLSPLDGICVSSSVREHVRQDLGVKFVDLGARQFKNLARPVRAYHIDLTGEAGAAPATVGGRRRVRRNGLAIACAALVALLAFGLLGWGKDWVPWRASVIEPYSAQDRRMTFAVMPVSAPANDPQAAQFAGRLTDALIVHQSNSVWSRVIPRVSTEEANAKYASAKDFGQALDVHFLVHGDVIRDGGIFSVSLSVIDARNDLVLRTEQFKWPVGKAPMANSRDLDSVMWNLADAGYMVEMEEAKRKKSDELDVRDLVLLAQGAWKHDAASYGIAMPMLQRALALAPIDRLALRLMAELNLCECRKSWATDPAKMERLGTEALEKGLDLYPDDRKLLGLRVELFIARGRIMDAQALVERLLKAEPEEEGLLTQKAFCLLRLGKPSEALTTAQAAARQGGDSRRLRALTSAINYALGRYADSAELARRVSIDYGQRSLADPRIGGVLLIRTAAEARLGRASQAREAFFDFADAVPQVKTIAAIKQWHDPRWSLAGFQPFYEGLRLAGVPE